MAAVWPSVIRIAITQASFGAIVQTMPFGSVNFEAGVDDKGERYIWLPRAVVDRLRALRGPGESFSGWRRRTHGTRAWSPLILAKTCARPGRARTSHRRYGALGSILTLGGHGPFRASALLIFDRFARGSGLSSRWIPSHGERKASRTAPPGAPTRRRASLKPLA
jgi:hypothetical protein